MKNTLFLLSLVLSCAACSPSNEPTQAAPINSMVASTTETLLVDKAQGFRKHKFGDNFSTFPPLVLVHQSTPDLLTYALKKGQEDLHFGKAKLSRITYTFYQHKFYGVTLFTTTPTALQQLTTEATTLYGPPSQQFEDLPAWPGKKVQDTFARPGFGTGVKQDTAYLQLLDKATLNTMLATGKRPQKRQATS